MLFMRFGGFDRSCPRFSCRDWTEGCFVSRIGKLNENDASNLILSKKKKNGGEMERIKGGRRKWQEIWLDNHRHPFHLKCIETSVSLRSSAQNWNLPDVGRHRIKAFSDPLNYVKLKDRRIMPTHIQIIINFVWSPRSVAQLLQYC